MTNCEIITIGDELLIGQVINTNVAWIAQQISLLGINVIRDTTVGDNENDIMNALHDSYEKSDITIVTGGLGPTNDDITKNCACKFFNSKLIFNENVYNNVVERFKTTHYCVTEQNRLQAMLPDNCIVLPNHYGTASGMLFKSIIDSKNKIMVFLPGVPAEMKGLMNDGVIPVIKEMFNLTGVYFRTVLTQGVGESFIAEKIKDFEDNLPENIKLAYLPQYGSVRLRLTAYGDNYEINRKTVETKLANLITLIPDIIYGYDDDTLEHAVGELLRQKKMTVSTAESCTGGNIAHLITSVPGSSDYFKGSIVSYSVEVKENILGVNKNTINKYNVVSKETVEEMAQHSITLFNTDIAIATSGIAGPTGGNNINPVGNIWIAVATKKIVNSKLFHFGLNREVNITRSSLNALKMVYDYLKNNQL